MSSEWIRTIILELGALRLTNWATRPIKNERKTSLIFNNYKKYKGNLKNAKKKCLFPLTFIACQPNEKYIFLLSLSVICSLNR
jgi:hypothetical protein